MWTVDQMAADSPFFDAWASMRMELWPDQDPDANDRECRSMLDLPGSLPVFVVLNGEGTAIGFAEARLRDYAEGCETSPVGYLEGWFVRDGWRGRGAGRALLQAVENWARSQGAVEMASDAAIDNRGSELAHKALGFEEAERIICFRKRLA